MISKFREYLNYKYSELKWDEYSQYFDEKLLNSKIPKSNIEVLKITIIYAIIGVFLILSLDELLNIIFRGKEQLIEFEIYKRCAYVTLTSIMLYFLINKNIKVIELIVKNLVKSYEKLNKTHEELIDTEEKLRKKYEELIETQKNLKESEQRYKLIIEGVNDAIWDWDLVNDLYYVFEVKRIIGMESFNIGNDMENYKKLIHPDDREYVYKAAKDHIEKKTPYYKSEYRIISQNNEYIWILSSGKAIWDSQGNPIRMSGSHTDITERKKTEEKIRRLAYYDYLTGLPNTNMFEERFNTELQKAKLENTKLALLYLDLDNFKKINDTLGHDYGNRLLKKVGALFRSCIKEKGIVSRLSGDEFAVLLTDVEDNNYIIKIVENIMGFFVDPWIFECYEFYISPSVGISIYPNDGSDFKSLLKNADIAMYNAKQNGKNGYCFYNTKINKKFIENIETEFDLRLAMQRDELVLHYQPQINLKSGLITGVEALIRWMHPVKGMILPIEFIPIAEESGLITEIGEWVIKAACNQNRIWREKGYGPLYIAVNLSAKQFKQINLVEVIENILKETDMDPNYLEIEITETIAMNDVEVAINTLNKLKKMGMKISLDDFGTGYSSLNYLNLLPIDTLKMDKSFISDINKELYEKEIVKSMINLAHSMKINVTAEGVETLDQLEFLNDHNCDKAQGYIFSKPVSSQSIESIMEKQKINSKER